MPRSWLAAFLALVVPGLGHLYVGRPRIALAVPLVQSAAVLLVPALSLWLGLSLMTVMLWGVLGVGIWLGQAVWATLIARALETPPPIRYRRAGIYVLFWLAATLVTSLSAAVTRGAVIEAFKVPAASMVPAILSGDQLFVAKLGPGSKADDYGDLVVFVQPQSGEIYIKRVIARGGDEVAFRDGRLHLNGAAVEREPCEEPLLTYRDGAGDGRWYDATGLCWLETLPNGTRYRVLTEPDEAMAASEFGPVTVPPDALFVLGDNRDHSYDSRAWGPVPLDLVIGRPRLIWWSMDPTTGLRSERIGLEL